MKNKELAICWLSERLIALQTCITQCHKQSLQGDLNLEASLQTLQVKMNDVYREMSEPDTTMILEGGLLDSVKFISANIMKLCQHLINGRFCAVAIELMENQLKCDALLEKHYVMDSKKIVHIKCGEILTENYYFLGHYYLLNKQFDLAEKYLKESVKHKPNTNQKYFFYERYYSDLAIIAVYRGNLKQAQKYVALAEFYIDQGFTLRENVGKELVATYGKIAHYYFNKDCWESAIEWYEEALLLLARRKEILISDEVQSFIYKNSQEIPQAVKQIEIVEKLLGISNAKLGDEKYQFFVSNAPDTLLKTVYNNNNFEISIMPNVECVDVFRSSLKYKHIPFEEIDDCFVFNLLEINIHKLLHLLKPPTHDSEESHFTDNNSSPAVPENLFKVYARPKEEESRHTIQKPDATIINSVSKIPISISNSPVIIQWNNSNHPPHIKGDIHSPYKKMRKKNGTTTYWFINACLEYEVANSVIFKRFNDIAERGKVYTNGKSENRQGFVFYDEDKDMKKFGKEYDCKIKGLGKYIGKLRFLGKKVAVGKKLQEGDKINNKQYELYEFDKLAWH
ncbi:MAG: hypothetical protein H0U71_00085 [Gammaproteobacteria bacterium]|nr:hypothetical protein [Gammaproteobacteria bacterium]